MKKEEKSRKLLSFLLFIQLRFVTIICFVGLIFIYLYAIPIIIKLSIGQPLSVKLFLYLFLICIVFFPLSSFIPTLYYQEYLLKLGLRLFNKNLRDFNKLSSLFGWKILKSFPWIALDFYTPWRNLLSSSFRHPEGELFFKKLELLGKSKDQITSNISKRITSLLTMQSLINKLVRIFFILMVLSVLFIIAEAIMFGGPCYHNGPIYHDFGKIPVNCNQTYQGYYYNMEEKKCVYYEGPECNNLPFEDLITCTNKCVK